MNEREIIADLPQVKWRDPETGRVRGGFLAAAQTDPATYRVGIPDWIAGDVSWLTIPREAVVVGNVPWPNDAWKPKPGQILVNQTPDYWAGAREHMDIVKELAGRGPFLNDRVDCATCPSGINGWSTIDQEHGVHQNPANHEPRCLWRRARELYPLA